MNQTLCHDKHPQKPAVQSMLWNPWGVFDVCQRPGERCVSQSVSPPAVGQVYSANVKGQESGLPELQLGNSSPVVAE